MKQCGHKETCFKHGKEKWGQLGDLLCTYLIGKELNTQPYSVCSDTEERVIFYMEKK